MGLHLQLSHAGHVLTHSSVSVTWFQILSGWQNRLTTTRHFMLRICNILQRLILSLLISQSVKRYGKAEKPLGDWTYLESRSSVWDLEGHRGASVLCPSLSVTWLTTVISCSYTLLLTQTGPHFYAFLPARDRNVSETVRFFFLT